MIGTATRLMLSTWVNDKTMPEHSDSSSLPHSHVFLHSELMRIIAMFSWKTTVLIMHLITMELDPKHIRDGYCRNYGFGTSCLKFYISQQMILSSFWWNDNIRNYQMNFFQCFDFLYSLYWNYYIISVANFIKYAWYNFVLIFIAMIVSKIQRSNIHASSASLVCIII